MDILVEAGVPAGALHYLSCSGADAGAHLVAHPRVDFIAFTGSREVGCGIWEEAGKTRPGQLNLKKVVCEMGGKNAMIIDNDADLDEAIPAALYSAFGFAGQKCSALSRLIVLRRSTTNSSGASSLRARHSPSAIRRRPARWSTRDRRRRAEIDPRLIEAGKQEAKLAWQAKLAPELVASGGYYVPPTVFTGCRSKHKSCARKSLAPCSRS